MKRTLITRLGVAAVALTLISTTMLSGTLAKYTSTASGTGNVMVAAWDVKFTKDGGAFIGDTNTFNLFDEAAVAADLVETGTIAPGSKGSFELAVNSTNTDVAFDYTIEMDNKNLGTVPIKFYSDAAYTTELVYTDNKLTTTGTVALDETTKNQTIYWKWAGLADTDAADTNYGIGDSEARKGSIDVKISATQKTS